MPRREDLETLYANPNKHMALKHIAVSEKKTLVQITDEMIDLFLATKPQDKVFELLGKINIPSAPANQ